MRIRSAIHFYSVIIVVSPVIGVGMAGGYLLEAYLHSKDSIKRLISTYKNRSLR